MSLFLSRLTNLAHVIIGYIQRIVVFISHRGKQIAFILLGNIFLYGVFISYQSYNAYLCRKNPKNIANNYFESLAPHQIIPRIILYIPGSKEYNAHIIYLSNKFKINNSLDCLFINNIERLAKKELIVEMASSMKNFGGCVANSILSDNRLTINDIDNISMDGGMDNIIIDAIKYQNNNPSLVDFIDRNLVKQHNGKLFENTIPYISAIENDVDYVSLFNKYYKDVYSDDRNNLIRRFGIIFNDKNINKLKKFYDSISSLLSDKEKKYLLYAIMVKSESLDETWFNARISNIKNYKLLYDSHYLNDLDAGTFDDFRETGNAKKDISKLILLAKELESIDQHASSLVYHALIHRIEDDIDIRVKKNMDNCSVDYFNCHDKWEQEDYDKLEENYNNIKNQEAVRMLSETPYQQIFTEINRILNSSTDSELKKNMIVLAYRSVDILNIYPNNVDEAFSGSEPRSILFKNIDDYLNKSEAITEYEMITEHKYLSEASKWPLNPYSRTDSDYMQSKYKKWKALIDKYPWHPSIDDIYLRLAFDKYNLNEYSQGLDEIKQYFSMQNRLDRSADTRLRVLLVYFLKKIDNNYLTKEYKILKDIYNMPYCLFDENCVMPVSSDINIIRKNEIVIDSSIFSDDQLEVIEEMLSLPKEEIIKKINDDNNKTNANIIDEDIDNEDIDNEDIDNEDIDNEDIDNEDIDNEDISYKSIIYDIALINVKKPKYIDNEIESPSSETCLDDDCDFSIEPIYGNSDKSVDIKNIKNKLDFHFGEKPDSNL